MNCVSSDVRVYHLGLFVFFPRIFLSSRVTGACPVTTDFIMRGNVRTTTTTTTTSKFKISPRVGVRTQASTLTLLVLEGNH